MHVLGETQGLAEEIRPGANAVDFLEHIFTEPINVLARYQVQ